MTEPSNPQEAGQRPPPEYLRANELLQQAMLLLVEDCHRPDYQETLGLSLQGLRETLKARGTEFAAANEHILRLVLRSCFDPDRQRTLAAMRESFATMNAGLASGEGARQESG